MRMKCVRCNVVFNAKQTSNKRGIAYNNMPDCPNCLDNWAVKRYKKSFNN